MSRYLASRIYSSNNISGYKDFHVLIIVKNSNILFFSIKYIVLFIKPYDNIIHNVAGISQITIVIGNRKSRLHQF